MSTVVVVPSAHRRSATLPRERTRVALRESVTERLTVTDAGYYPSAAEHLVERPHGAAQNILLMCLEGRGWAQANGCHIEVGPGQALILPKWQTHAYGADPEFPWTIWWLHIDGADCPSLLDALLPGGLIRPFPIGDQLEAVELAERVFVSLSAGSARPNRVSAAGAAWQLLARLAVGTSVREASPQMRLRSALQQIESNPARRISTADLSRAVGLSEVQLIKLFRAETGSTLAAYLTSLRNTRARYLLTHSTLSIAEISGRVGFDDQYYFSRRFKQLNGMSPSEFRNRT